MPKRAALVPVTIAFLALSTPGRPIAGDDVAEFAVRRIPVGREPSSVEIADVNRDGKPDLVVVNAGSNDVTVLLGDGRGGFTPAPGSPYPAGHSPNDVAVADLNHDGNPDLVFANHDTSYLTILLGDGKGGFTPAPSSPLTVHSHPHPHGVAVADFDGDGHLDLVTDSWGENKVTVLFGDGKGGFTSPGTTFDVGPRPYQRVRSADLNGDGRSDIVTTNLDGASVTVLLSDGKRGFVRAPGSPFPAGQKPFGVAIGDVNGDGRLDLVVGNWSGHPEDSSSDAVNVLLGDGKGGFSPLPGSPLRAGRAPARVAIGDLNGDGIGDVAVANYIGDDVTIFFGGKRGLRRGPTLKAGHRPEGIAIGDLNGDGLGDVVTADSADGTITLFLSTGGKAPPSKRTVAPTPAVPLASPAGLRPPEGTTAGAERASAGPRLPLAG
ncbi:MAG: FG-GAP repeat domain-containing protein [Thermoanaerobaculia bacterium]